MPNPNFVPVIGRDFSDVMNQQANWARFNAGIESDNVNRMVRADDQRNNWLRDVAIMARQDAANDQQMALNANLTARQNALLSQQEGRRQYEWEQGRKDATKQLTVQQEMQREGWDRQEQMNKQKMDASLATKQANIDVVGQNIASQFVRLKNNYDAAKAAYDSLQAQIDKTESDIETEKDLTKQAMLKDRRKVLMNQVRQADHDRTRAQNMFDTMLQKANDDGFIINEDDASMINKFTNQRWVLKPFDMTSAATGAGKYSMPGSIGDFIQQPDIPTGTAAPITGVNAPQLWGGLNAATTNITAEKVPGTNRVRVVSVTPK